MTSAAAPREQARDHRRDAPLAGVRVLELAGQLSGPYGAMVLADLGADVIKIESPARPDPARLVPSARVGGHTTYYLSLNRNKRSVLLDLKDGDGLDAFLRLVEHADVVLDNFRPGVTARLGVDHDRLAERNPSIITCSLSGFGETGPERDRPGYDYLMQALAGTMSLTGEPDAPPTKYGVSVVDHVGGLFSAIGILAALAARDRDPDRRGRHLDLALFDTHLSLLTYLAGDLLNGGDVPTRQPLSAHPRLVPAQLFATADSWIVVMPLANHFFPPLCEALGLPELAADPRFADAEGRLAHREELLAVLQRRFGERATADWSAELDARGVPAAPVQTVAEALAMEQVAARDMVVDLDHASYGSYRAIGDPVKFSGDDARRWRAAPVAGEDTVDVLREVAGLSADAIDRLRAAGIAHADDGRSQEVAR
jgi:crotonobetainyl-CoA:carnitine CoA-transferase CaiB-like acyl-CoA transferase